jgi:hypothetical protein
VRSGRTLVKCILKDCGMLIFKNESDSPAWIWLKESVV